MTTNEFIAAALDGAMGAPSERMLRELADIAAAEERANAARLALYVPTPPGCLEADPLRQAIRDEIIAGTRAYD